MHISGSRHLKVWTPRQRCAGQRGVRKSLQLRPPTDPPYTSEFNSVLFLVLSVVVLQAIYGLKYCVHNELIARHRQPQ